MTHTQTITVTQGQRHTNYNRTVLESTRALDLGTGRAPDYSSRQKSPFPCK